jgi:hypothetical protein
VCEKEPRKSKLALNFRHAKPTHIAHFRVFSRRECSLATARLGYDLDRFEPSNAP